MSDKQRNRIDIGANSQFEQVDDGVDLVSVEAPPRRGKGSGGENPVIEILMSMEVNPKKALRLAFDVYNLNYIKAGITAMKTKVPGSLFVYRAYDNYAYVWRTA